MMTVPARWSLLLTLLLLAPAALAEVHSSRLPELTRDGPYPLQTLEALAENGFPDHKHACFWPDWKPLVDEDGDPYGVGSLCTGLVWRDREDVIQEAGLIILGMVKLDYHLDYNRCVVAPFVELTEMALGDVYDLLDLAPVDTLRIENTNNVAAYTSRTGYGTWRMYKRAGDLCILQPIPVLIARTLAAHAAYDLVTGWLLDEHGCGDLPHWLRQGLAAYVAEMGVHLNNYMLQFRPEGDILLTPDEAERLLAAEPIVDPNLDRMMYRQARYAAFLMVWRLIEERGGMSAMREFVTAVGEGHDPDTASAKIWGADLAALAASLDPTVLGEPQGDAVQSRRPHMKPVAQAEE